MQYTIYILKTPCNIVMKEQQSLVKYTDNLIVLVLMKYMYMRDLEIHERARTKFTSRIFVGNKYKILNILINFPTFIKLYCATNGWREPPLPLHSSLCRPSAVTIRNSNRSHRFRLLFCGVYGARRQYAVLAVGQKSNSIQYKNKNCSLHCTRPVVFLSIVFNDCRYSGTYLPKVK